MFQYDAPVNPGDTVNILSHMLAGNALSQPISVAAQLGIADLLADGARSSEELAAATHAQPDALFRLLRALSCLGIFTQIEPRRFALTSVGALLRKGVPGSLHSVALLAGQPWRAASYDLLASVKSGASAFEQRFGMNLYDWFERHPESGKIFNEVQATHAAAIELGQAVDFTTARRVVDVGGGTGGMLRKLLAEQPHLEAILYDREQAIAQARPLLEGLQDRCQTLAGDFFHHVPSDGDVYLLCFVLHNWDDDRAVRILQCCHAAMSSGARLLIVENLLLDAAPSSLAALLDLEMLVFTNGGRERTAEEYYALLAAAEFEHLRVSPTGTTASVIEVRRR